MSNKCFEREIKRLITPFIIKIVSGFLLLLVGSFMAFFIPLISRKLINTIVYGDVTNSYRLYIMLLIISILIREGFIILSYFIFEITSREFVGRLRCSLFETLQYFFGSFSNLDTGRLITYLDSDTQKIQLFLYPTLIHALKDVVILFSALGVGIYFNSILLAISLVPIVIIFLIAKVVNPKIRFLSKDLLEKHTHFVSILKQFIESMEVFLVFLKEKFSVLKFRETNERYLQSDLKRIKSIIFYNVPITILYNSGYFIALVVGAYYVKEGKMDIGALFGILMVVEFIYSSTKGLWDFNVHLQEIKEVKKRLEVILIKKNNVFPLRDSLFVKLDRINELKVDIRFFSYKKGQIPVLEDIRFVLHRNEIMGIIGKSGAGKSTILRIILGLLAREENFVLVNGFPIIKINLREYYSRLGYLSQKKIIFEGTVKENIFMGEKNEISEEIKELLEGIPLEKKLEESGRNLSGGEIQRIQLARVFMLQDRDIYILDEPFVHLDHKSIKIVRKIIKNLAKNSSIIIVSHQLEYIRGVMDKYIALDQIY